MMHVPVRRPKVPVVRIEAYVFKCRIRGGGGLAVLCKKEYLSPFSQRIFLKE